MCTTCDTQLGHTDREIACHRDVVAKSRSALIPAWRLLWEFDGDTATACRLYDAIGQSRSANARQIVIDWVDGSHFIALTDCPMAYLKMEASRLGIRNIEPLICSADSEALADYQRSIDALERGEPAPDEIPARWR